MPRISIWWKLAALGLIGYLAAAAFFGTDAQAQKDDKGKNVRLVRAQKKDNPTKTYYGIEGCRTGGPGGPGCHNQKETEARPEGSVCRQNEIRFWLKNDKHSTAYRVLITTEKDADGYAKLDLARYTKADKEKLAEELGKKDESLKKKIEAAKDKDDYEEILQKTLLKKVAKDTFDANARARQMEKILAKTDRAKLVKGEYRLIKDPGCLACHAQVIDPKLDDRDDKDKKLDKRTVQPSFHEEEGVNCVVCHGPYREWVVKHTGILTGSDAWRKLDRTTKEESGMNDLWDPAKRTRLCASCHIGHNGDGKDVPERFVTHEMYAAGHPPLPGFEVATFSNEMPRHWDYIREKDKAVLKSQNLDIKYFQVEQTQLVFSGAATALEEQMRLLVGQANQAEKKDQLLDLSNFDCYACHHSLTGDAWRQKRGYGERRPGRLPMRHWSTELIKLAVHYAEDDKDARAKRYSEYEKLLADIKEAFTSQMYGNRKQISEKAAKLADWAKKLADDLIEKTKKTPATAKDARMLYRAIPITYSMDKAKDWVDFDSARQIAWGFKVPFYEVNNLDWFSGMEVLKSGKTKEPGKEVAAIRDLLGKNGALGKMLKLDLPNKPKSIDDDLAETLKRLNEYHPKKFNEQLKALNDALSKMPKD
jgi:hypothetical protein